jgi:hypothetical protein
MVEFQVALCEALLACYKEFLEDQMAMEATTEAPRPPCPNLMDVHWGGKGLGMFQ